MAEYTSNLNLEKPSGNENFRRQAINDSMDKIDIKFGVGTGEGHTHDGTAGQGKKISYNSLSDKPAAISPTAHKSTHAAGGADALTYADIGAAAQAEFSAHLADYMKHGISATTDAGGTSTAYTLTPNPALPAYAVGLKVTAFFDKANTGAVMLNISGKGAKGWKKQDGTDYGVGEIQPDRPYTGIYNGTSFLANSSAGLGEFFGDGSDGALNTAGNVVLDVPIEDVSVVVKQYTSIHINAGHTVSLNKRCRGLVIYCSGDCIIDGTLDVSGKGALRVDPAILPPILVTGLKKVLDITDAQAISIPLMGAGGAGGKGGDAWTPGGAGGAGAQATRFAGGLGGGGGGGAARAYNSTVAPGAGGAAHPLNIGTGGPAAVASTSGAIGDSYIYGIGVSGGVGSGGSGSAIYYYASGACSLTSGAGGNNAAGSGGGGGAGGGAIVVLHRGSNNFTGTLQVNGGLGGGGGAGAYTSNYGSAGNSGSSGGIGGYYVGQI